MKLLKKNSSTTVNRVGHALPLSVSLNVPA
jgi:hypothetical protein